MPHVAVFHWSRKPIERMWFEDVSGNGGIDPARRTICGIRGLVIRGS
jgi:hypothetical protein